MDIKYEIGYLPESYDATIDKLYTTDIYVAWIDISRLINTNDTTITSYVCTTEYKSAVDAAEFTVRPANLTLWATLIEYLTNNETVLVRITLGGELTYSGIIDKSNLTILTKRIPQSFTISCRDASAIRLDDDVEDYVVLENETILNCVVTLAEMAGYSFNTAVMRDEDNETLPVFVVDADDADSYRDYIDTLLFEAGGYVLNTLADGTLEIFRIPYDTYADGDIEDMEGYIVDDGVQTSLKVLEDDGIELEWGTTAEAEEQIVYVDDISRSIEDVDTDGDGTNDYSEMRGLDVADQGYYPEDGDITATYQEFDSNMLDRDYNTAISRSRNEDLKILAVRDVEAYTIAYAYDDYDDDGEPTDTAKLKTSPLDADIWNMPVLSSLGMEENPTIYPTKAWYLLQNNYGKTVNLQFFQLVGRVIYIDKSYTSLYPSTAVSPKEYEADYIYNEDHATRFLKFYWSFKSYGRFVSTYKTIGEVEAGAVRMIRHKVSDSTSYYQAALVVNSAKSFVGDQMFTTVTAVALSEVEAEVTTVINNASTNTTAQTIDLSLSSSYYHFNSEGELTNTEDITATCTQSPTYFTEYWYVDGVLQEDLTGLATISVPYSLFGDADSITLRVLAGAKTATATIYKIIDGASVEVSYCWGDSSTEPPVDGEWTSTIPEQPELYMYLWRRDRTTGTSSYSYTLLTSTTIDFDLSCSESTYALSARGVTIGDTVYLDTDGDGETDGRYVSTPLIFTVNRTNILSAYEVTWVYSPSTVFASAVGDTLTIYLPYKTSIDKVSVTASFADIEDLSEKTLVITGSGTEANPTAQYVGTYQYVSAGSGESLPDEMEAGTYFDLEVDGEVTRYYCQDGESWTTGTPEPTVVLPTLTEDEEPLISGDSAVYILEVDGVNYVYAYYYLNSSWVEISTVNVSDLTSLQALKDTIEVVLASMDQFVDDLGVYKLYAETIYASKVVATQIATQELHITNDGVMYGGVYDSDGEINEESTATGGFYFNSDGTAKLTEAEIDNANISIANITNTTITGNVVINSPSLVIDSDVFDVTNVAQTGNTYDLVAYTEPDVWLFSEVWSAIGAKLSTTVFTTGTTITYGSGDGTAYQAAMLMPASSSWSSPTVSGAGCSANGSSVSLSGGTYSTSGSTYTNSTGRPIRIAAVLAATERYGENDDGDIRYDVTSSVTVTVSGTSYTLTASAEATQSLSATYYFWLMPTETITSSAWAMKRTYGDNDNKVYSSASATVSLVGYLDVPSLSSGHYKTSTASTSSTLTGLTVHGYEQRIVITYRTASSITCTVGGSSVSLTNLSSGCYYYGSIAGKSGAVVVTCSNATNVSVWIDFNTSYSGTQRMVLANTSGAITSITSNSNYYFTTAYALSDGVGGATTKTTFSYGTSIDSSSSTYTKYYSFNGWVNANSATIASIISAGGTIKLSSAQTMKLMGTSVSSVLYFIASHSTYTTVKLQSASNIKTFSCISGASGTGYSTATTSDYSITNETESVGVNVDGELAVTGTSEFTGLITATNGVYVPSSAVNQSTVLTSFAGYGREACAGTENGTGTSGSWIKWADITIDTSWGSVCTTFLVTEGYSISGSGLLTAYIRQGYLGAISGTPTLYWEAIDSGSDWNTNYFCMCYYADTSAGTVTAELYVYTEYAYGRFWHFTELATASGSYKGAGRDHYWNLYTNVLSAHQGDVRPSGYTVVYSKDRTKYDVGDTFSVTKENCFAGYVSNAKTELTIYVPLDKPYNTNSVSSVSFSGTYIDARPVSGGYLIGGSYNNTTFSNFTSVTLYLINGHGIRMYCYYSSGFGVTNNTPCNVSFTGTFTFA